MMTKANEAAALFRHGFSCSQAVLSVFAKQFGLERDIALRISQGFGAGMGYTSLFMRTGITTKRCL